MNVLHLLSPLLCTIPPAVSAFHIFSNSHHLTSAVQRYDTDPPSRTPLRVWVLHVFFSSCASLQIIFHAAPGKKRLVIPYDRPFKQKCRDAGGLCGGYTGSGAGSKVASYQRHFYVNARSCQMWSYHAIWRIASACCNVDASVTMLVGSCRNAVLSSRRGIAGTCGTKEP